MATRERRSADENEKTKAPGFEAPCIVEVLPKGTTYRTNPDGTITLIYPDKTDEEEIIIDLVRRDSFTPPAKQVVRKQEMSKKIGEVSDGTEKT